jgi:hypothetical protein
MTWKTVTGALAVASLATVTLTMGAPALAATTPLVVSGNGLSIVHLGASESTAVTILTRTLGAPSTKLTATTGLANCGVTASAGWHAMTAYFDHGKVVGFSFGPAHAPSVRTSAGLTLGSTLTRARQIYGKHLTTSNAQGGVWFATTSSGRIDGFLIPSTGRAPTGASRINTIDVGVVGCPAMSP